MFWWDYPSLCWALSWLAPTLSILISVLSSFTESPKKAYIYRSFREWFSELPEGRGTVGCFDMFQWGKCTLCPSVFTTTFCLYYNHQPLRITVNGAKPGNCNIWVTVCFIYLSDWSCVCGWENQIFVSCFTLLSHSQEEALVRPEFETSQLKDLGEASGWCRLTPALCPRNQAWGC